MREKTTQMTDWKKIFANMFDRKGFIPVNRDSGKSTRKQTDRPSGIWTKTTDRRFTGEIPVAHTHVKRHPPPLVAKKCRFNQDTVGQ